MGDRLREGQPEFLLDPWEVDKAVDVYGLIDKAYDKASKLVNIVDEGSKLKDLLEELIEDLDPTVSSLHMVIEENEGRMNTETKVKWKRLQSGGF